MPGSAQEAMRSRKLILVAQTERRTNERVGGGMVTAKCVWHEEKKIRFARWKSLPSTLSADSLSSGSRDDTNASIRDCRRTRKTFLSSNCLATNKGKPQLCLSLKQIKSGIRRQFQSVVARKKEERNFDSKPQRGSQRILSVFDYRQSISPN